MRYVIIIIAICAVIVGVVFVIGPADAKTIIVDDDWAGADYRDIGSAIANAKDGDTIRVYSGTYYEANVVPVSVNLVGNGTSTVINGYKKDHVFGFDLQGGNTTVSGFKFNNWWPTHHYGAVGVYSDGNRISNNTFYNNGRGVFLGGCMDNHVINNTFDKNYYGLLVYDGADKLNVAFNHFSRNYMADCSIGYSSGLEIFSNTFMNYSRRAISVHRSQDASLSYNMFDASLSTSGTENGITLYEVMNPSVQNNTFIRNYRALRLWGTTDAEVSDNTFIGGYEAIQFARTWSGENPLGKWCNGTTVRNNNLIGQTGYGANVSSTQVTAIDARYNWWGAASGPYHPVNNTKGTGTTVSNTVTFDHWLTRMVTDLPPIAYIYAVGPSIVNEGEAVSFSGWGLARNETVELVWSSDIDGTLYAGPDTSFATSDLSPGIHTISLKVKDSYGRWSGEVIVKVTVNGIPVASIDSIAPPVVNNGEVVTFKGIAIDFEDDIRYVIWESDIDGMLSNELEFETTTLSNGTHAITLTVMDGYKTWSEAAVGEVIVNGRPIALIDAVEHPNANEGDAIIFRGAYIDHEDGAISFEWSSDIDGTLSDQQMFHTSLLSNGTHAITFRVLDDFMVWSEYVTATVTVNGLPRASIVSVAPQLSNTGEPVSFDGDAFDHEGKVLDFEWRSDIDGLLSDQEDFSTTRLSPGVHTITFRAMDGHRKWSVRDWTTVTVNGRPEAWIEPSEVRLVHEGEAFHLAGGFFDPEGDVRAYEWTSDIDGVVGTFYNLTTSDLSNGSHTISFRVMDGMGSWSAEATAQVVVNGLPHAMLVGISPGSALQGSPVHFTGAYVDHEADIYEFEWTSDRDGRLSDEMGFSTSSLSNGTHVITLRVMDGHGAWSDPVTGRVTINGRPTCWIEEAGPSLVMEGERVHFAGAAEDDLAIVAYRWTSSIDGVLSHLAVFSTRDLSPGIHDISFQARDDRDAWSLASSAIIEVGTLTVDAEVVSMDIPAYAIEGTEVVVGCTIENTGDVPLIGLVISLELGEYVVGVHTLTEPLHPGSSRTVEFRWITETGNHTAHVDVVLDDVVLGSSTSTGTLDVDPLPDDDDDDTEPPLPDDNSQVTDGNDAPGMTLVLLLLAVLVATGYLRRSRSRRSP